MTNKEAKREIRQKNKKVFLAGMSLGAAAIAAAVCAGASLEKNADPGKLPHFSWKGNLFRKDSNG